MTMAFLLAPRSHRDGATSEQTVRTHFKVREPMLITDDGPDIEHVLHVRAALDEEAGRFVVSADLDQSVVFEADAEDEICNRAGRILDTLIAHNNWPDRGWLIVADVYPRLGDVIDTD